MNLLRVTLLTDGPTDAALLHPLRWLLVQNGVVRPIQLVWADLRPLPKQPSGLTQKVAKALDLYPCDLLLVHRDAERETRAVRLAEIQRAVRNCTTELFEQRPYICVVPVRMTEAWFLFHEKAIRQAAGNPAGTVWLEMPALGRLEDLPDPKATLLGLLREATELPPRRRQRVSLVQAVDRLAEFIDDFSPLRRLPAFTALEADLRAVIDANSWR